MYIVIPQNEHFQRCMNGNDKQGVWMACKYVLVDCNQHVLIGTMSCEVMGG